MAGPTWKSYRVLRDVSVMFLKYPSHVAPCQYVLHVFCVLLAEGPKGKLRDEPIKTISVVLVILY
jgi:hypothetical protein